MLAHQFAIIPMNSDKSIIMPNMDFISIDDTIINYIGDSLKWIYSTWNGQEVKSGLSYYGFSIIQNDELLKFLNIIKQWRNLFYHSPEEFYLTGDYLPENAQYEKILIKKVDLINKLDALILLCKKAKLHKSCILHNGI